jgi:ureidoglycolate lyase
MSAGILRTRHSMVTRCLTPTNAIGAKPDPGAIACLRIGGNAALALHRAAWHAGPFLAAPELDIRNLEMSGMNETDHHSVRLNAEFGLVFESLP